MGRRTVWIPDELEATALEQLTGINWSAALQAGVRALLECGHPELVCAGCGAATTARAVTAGPLHRFYRTIVFELGQRVDQPGYEGAARVIQRVAVDHEVPDVDQVALRRATRINHQVRRDVDVIALPREPDSRANHPTARPVPADHPGPRATTNQETA